MLYFVNERALVFCPVLGPKINFLRDKREKRIFAPCQRKVINK